MPIPLFLLDRIKGSAMSGPQMADALANMAQVADQTGIDRCAINIEFVSDDDKLFPGDLIPTLMLSLERRPDAIEVVLEAGDGSGA